MLVGQIFLSYDQYDQAIDALKRGIKKGGEPDVDEAQVSPGIAYLNQGNKELANQAFNAVRKDSQWQAWPNSGCCGLMIMRRSTDGQVDVIPEHDNLVTPG